MCREDGSALFFTCALIEQMGRTLHLERGKIVEAIGETSVGVIYKNADILHCEPIEKVADDAIEEFGLASGDYDNVARARYLVPDVWTIGKVYARLIEDVVDEDVVKALLSVYSSWIDRMISDYNSSFYYQPRDYVAECFRQGTVLDG